jgi:hypothetical protein
MRWRRAGTFESGRAMSQLDWEKLFKRYILDDDKTPYFTAVARLTRRQARYELFAYCLLTGAIYLIVGVASLSPKLPHGHAIGVPLYAFALLWAAIMLGVLRHPVAAACCATAPVAAMMYLLLFGFHPNIGTGDKVLIVALLLLWMRYNLRILAIARGFPEMPERPGPS